MNEIGEILIPEVSANQNPNNGSASESHRVRHLVLVTIGLVTAFSLPLYHLVRFSLSRDLYSHIILIPCVSAYLVWTKRRALPPTSLPYTRLAIIFFTAGAGALAAYVFAFFTAGRLVSEDSLALTTLAFVLLFLGACAFYLGRPVMGALAFPLGFLVFMVPFPTFFQDWLEAVLQHGSAAVAYGFFAFSGTPFLYDHLVFQLPGMAIRVAPECSGIHSSLALFITSVLAAWYFLRSPWRRATLAMAVFPLALLRNGFRVFTIGELCVHVSPDMINSPIHRKGGPLFFALSLIPFFLLLFWLIKSERHVQRPLPEV